MFDDFWDFLFWFVHFSFRCFIGMYVIGAVIWGFTMGTTFIFTGESFNLLDWLHDRPAWSDEEGSWIYYQRCYDVNGIKKEVLDAVK